MFLCLVLDVLNQLVVIGMTEQLLSLESSRQAGETVMEK